MSAPSGQASFGSSPAGGPAPPGGAYGSSMYAPPADARDDPSEPGRHGDAASEHLYAKRGRFSAWPYVVIAFLMEAAFIGCALGLPIGMLLGHVTKSDGVLGVATAVVAAPTGLGGAYLVFRDRWRTIEAFSSRFCVGIMNISLMFVPFVAFVYANVRGLRKLGGT